MAKLLRLFAPKLYIYRNGTNSRVVGPEGVLDAIKGFGGYVVIGDALVIAMVLTLGNFTIGSASIGGYSISEMVTVPVTADENRKLRKGWME